jgi:integrase
MSNKKDFFDLETIKKHRPNLSDSSLKTYRSILTNLYKKINPEDKYDKDYFITHPRQVIIFLKDIKPGLRKTTLSALTVYTLDDDKVSNLYKIQMMKDGKVYSDDIINQEKTKKQKENWITQDEVLLKYNALEKVVKPIFNDSGSLSTRDLEKIQDYIIASVYVLIPPRRLLDYSDFKLKDYVEGEDNYMKNGSFYFNKFKTAKFKKDTFKVPTKLKNIIQKWGRISESKFLLFQSRNKDKQISPSFLNSSLHRIFGGKISVNNLRHSFLTDYYKDTPALKDMNQIADQMGHSISTALEYVKKD